MAKRTKKVIEKEAEAPQEEVVGEVEELKPERDQSDEIRFFSLYGADRPLPQNTEVVENSGGLHLILRGEDGSLYAIPYVQGSHRDLKPGDTWRIE